jgi:transcriptional regulator with XRE-family HTH domain
MELAHWLEDMSQPHISYLESQRKKPSLDLIVRIAEVFGVTTDYLLRDELPVENPTRFAENPTSDQEDHSQMQLLGAKIRALRNQYGWKQGDVAQRLAPVTQAHISYLEAGRKTPSPELVIQLADVFGVTTDYLLRDSMPLHTSDE